MDSNFEVTFLGTSGSCTYSSRNRIKYGSNTPCVAVKAGDEILIFDTGSGICGYNELKDYQREHLHVFFSHYHNDHLNGLLFFSSMFDAGKRIDLYGSGNEQNNFYAIIDKFLSPPLHPVGIEAFKAECKFHTISEGDSILLSDNVTVRTIGLSHPGGSIGYRVECGGKSLCYCTDVELIKHQNDLKLLEFTKNSDLLILDAYFNDNNVIPGWGHSSWREAAEWAKRADVKKLALFHYGFMFFDTDIDIMADKAVKIFPKTYASAERMQIEI